MVSAIILAYNRCSEVLLTLNKLSAMQPTLPFELEIIVVDNASRDNTSASVRKEYPDVVLITKLQNNGIAGWNSGFAMAKGDYFLVLDDDSCIESGFAEAIAYLEENKDTGILALNIVDPALRGDPDLKPEEAWQDQALVVGFIGCGALIRKEVYEHIGGYAEWIYLYTHEFDYAIRCLQADFEIRFFAKGIVVHRASSLNRSKKNLRIFGTRNELAIIYKYFGSKQFKFLSRTLINNLKVLKKEGLASAWHVLIGFRRFLSMKKSLIRTPVSAEVQEFYAQNFWSAKPVLNKPSIIKK